MHIAIASHELAVSSQATGLGKPYGATVSVAMSRTSLLTLVSQQPPDIIVIDLVLLMPDAELITELRRLALPGCLIAAFGPHVQVRQLQTARDAGCDAVWPRGQWVHRVQEWLSAGDRG